MVDLIISGFWSTLTTRQQQKDDRISVPYVLLYYLPVTCNADFRMLYASAKELMKNRAGVGRIIDIDSADELENIPDKLRE